MRIITQIAHPRTIATIMLEYFTDAQIAQMNTTQRERAESISTQLESLFIDLHLLNLPFNPRDAIFSIYDNARDLTDDD
jgi:hypothetical protein